MNNFFRFPRFPEIDAARGLAVLGMLAFNWQFALAFYGLYSFEVYFGFWFWFARLVGAAFLFLAGVSLWLNLQRDTEVHAVFHATKIFAFGLLVTLATWLAIPDLFVAFGILHCIGLSLLLAIPLVNVKPRIIAFAGLAVVAAGIFLNDLTFSFPWLLWLGFVPAGFHSVDYFPVAPWLGFMLLGLAFAKKFYSQNKTPFQSLFQSEKQSGAFAGFAGVLRFLGRHSLAFYLLHQPVLLAALLFAGAHPAGLNLFWL